MRDTVEKKTVEKKTVEKKTVKKETVKKKAPEVSKTVKKETVTREVRKPAATVSKGASSGKATAGKAAAGVAGAAGVAKAAGVGGTGDIAGRGIGGGGGSWGWLKWVLGLIGLLVLLGLIFWACSGGGDDDEAAVTTPAATAVPATAEPESTATPEPEPTEAPEPTPEPAPDPTATPEPEPEPEPTAAPAPDPTPTAEPQPSCNSLVRVLDDADFSTLVAAITAADAINALSNSGALTIFAPTDEAFAAVPADIVATLLGDQALLTSVLTYHVVEGNVLSSDLAPAAVETLNGSSLAVRTDGSAPTVNASGLPVVDLTANDCVIHAIDSVLIPPSLLTTLGVDSLNAAVFGSPISFVDGSADFTDADSATLTAICNLVATEGSTDGLPGIQWQSSSDAEVNAEREAAIDDALASCGPGGLTFDQIGAPTPSFTG